VKEPAVQQREIQAVFYGFMEKETSFVNFLNGVVVLGVCRFNQK